jgi:hypothetical protein
VEAVTPSVTPAASAALPMATVVPPAKDEATSTLASVVESVTSPRKWLDFLLPSRASRETEPAATSGVQESAPAEASINAAQDVAPTDSAISTPQDVVPTPAPVEAAPVAEVSSISAAPVADADVSEVVTQSAASLEIAQIFAQAPPPAEAPAAAETTVEQTVEESGQHWSEIASQLAAEAPLVEAAQTAMNSERPSASDSVAAEFTAAEPALTESHAPESHSPQTELRASEDSAVHVPSTAAAESVAAAIERASSVSQAPPSPPNVDEVVAKILEKLGPQIQDLLAKGLVRPLVEDMLKNPEDKKK